MFLASKRPPMIPNKVIKRRLSKAAGTKVPLKAEAVDLAEAPVSDVELVRAVDFLEEEVLDSRILLFDYEVTVISDSSVQCTYVLM